MEKRAEFTNTDYDFISAPGLRRSRLYHLAPIGIGTPEVESLTGYIARLSAAHRISVYSFYKYLVFSIIQKASVFWGRSVLSSAYVRSLNGIGTIAKDAVDAIGALTMRSDISHLTWLFWSDTLSLSKLFKPQRVWCPCCYEDWRITGRVIYEPLIWTLNAIEVCTKHRMRLRPDCPHCGRSQEWLAHRSRPGYCNKCREWLGTSGVSDSQRSCKLLEVSEWEYQQWVSESIGALLAASLSLSVKPTKEASVESLTLCVEKFTRGNAEAFSKILPIAVYQIGRWKRGKLQPQLGTILKLCYLMGVNLVDFLTGHIDVEQLTVAVQSFAIQHPYESQKQAVKTDRRAIGRKFKRVLRSKKMPPSVTALAARWNINVALLHRYFPEMCQTVIERRRVDEKARADFQREYLKAALAENPPRSLKRIIRTMSPRSWRAQIEKRHPELCKAIRNRYHKYQVDLKKRNERELKREIRQAAIKLHRQSTYPSTNVVAARLSVPSRMSSLAARSVLREVQRELGY